MYLSGHLLALLVICGVSGDENDPASAPAADPPVPPVADPVQKSAGDRIKQQDDRIEEEKSVDDLSVQDELPSIAESEYCGAQVHKFCSRKVIASDDYLVYNCLEQAAARGKLIDEACQHFLWIWKGSQTQNPHIQQEAMEVCPKKKIQAITGADKGRHN